MLPHLKALKSLADLYADDLALNIFYMQNPHEKYKVIKNAVGDLVFKIDFQSNPITLADDVIKQRDKYLDILNEQYQKITETPKSATFTIDLLCGYVPWRLHDTHFHVALDDYVNCPFTTMAEISELITKIIETVPTN
jgi:hypothetical protein